MKMENKMKIDIITIHRLHNFGSVFQAVALYKYVSDLGYNTEVIDYHPKYLENLTWKNAVAHVLFAKLYNSRKRKFEKFINENLLLTSKRYSSERELEMYPPKADVYMAGGDQLWNPSYPCGNDDAYKFSFSDGVKLSYGTSLGKKTFSPDEIKELSNKIKCFKAISVRESSSVKILKTAGIHAEWVVDPVLLQERGYYENFAKTPNRKPYAFIYLVSPSNTLDRIVEIMKSKYHLEIVVYSGFGKKCNCDYQLYDLGPDEVLGYIRGAEYVISASFHATLFSIIFKKQFLALLPGEGSNERIEDLLEWTGLPDRIVTEQSDIEGRFLTSVQYTKDLDRVILERINSSKYYLEKNLEKLSRDYDEDDNCRE